MKAEKKLENFYFQADSGAKSTEMSKFDEILP